MKKAVIGIGTNIGNREENIKNAVAALSLVPDVRVLRESSVYETEPWGFTEQQSFYNCVVEVETGHSPEALLGICLGIEAGMGRIRKFRNGPRVIDLDVLVFEDYESGTDELVLPHRFIGERDFVLIPLKELFDDMNILGFSYSEEYEKIVESSSAKKIEKN